MRQKIYALDSLKKKYILFSPINNILAFPDGKFSYMCRIDEKPGDLWDLTRVAVDALGAAMLVTIILDLWRLFLGSIVPMSESRQCLQPGLPWFPGHVNET